jgi:aldose 1-epimerase
MVISPTLHRFVSELKTCNMKKFSIFLSITVWVVIILSGCNGTGDKSSKTGADSLKLSVMKEKFGTADEKPVWLFTLRNSHGITVKITNYGAIITSMIVPDKSGKPGDIVLGYDSLKQYINNNPYFGAIVGRYANRIANGKFTLDRKNYTLAKNNGNNSLHGGLKGFDKVVWDVKVMQDSTQAGLILSYLSKDGEEGYPGNLQVTVTCTLNNENEFQTTIEAATDKPTPVNLCNHSYFNLSCADTNILGHLLTINADRYTVVDDNLIPTGELRPVYNGPMDFTAPNLVGARIDQVKGGYDHNYVLVKKGSDLSFAARVEEPKSGRIMEILTTQPGIQFYSGNFLDGTIRGKSGKVYQQHYGLCLETQHFPDSPNQSSFPNTILRPGEKYRETTIYKFAK